MTLRRMRWLLSALIKRHQRLTALILLGIISLALAYRYTSQLPLQESLLGLVSEVKYSEGLVGVPQNLNPLFISTDSERDLSRLVFRSLTTTTLAGETIGDLAQNWEISSSGQVYLFHLKPGLKFQNGDPLTPTDVAFTYELAKNSLTGSKYADTFKNLEIQVVGVDSILFRLSDPFSPFLTLTNLGILPQKVLSKIPPGDLRFAKFNLSPVGSSDFRLTSLNSEGATFAKGGSVYSFRFYKNSNDVATALRLGEIKAAGFTETEDFSGWKNLQVLSSPLYERFVGVFYNLRTGVTQDRNLRQGLSFAINRDHLIKDTLLGGGEPAYGPIPSVSWAKAELQRKYDYNLDNAKSSLEKSGWTGGPVRQKDNKPLEISLSFRDSSQFKKIAEAVADNWAGVGVRAILNPLSAADFKSKVLDGKDFQAAIFTQEVGVDPDQYVLWHTTQDNLSNVTGLKLPKLDKTLEDGRHLADKADRLAKYADFQRFILEEEPVSFLFYPKYSFVISTKIQGIDLKPLGVPSDRFSDINSWKISRTIF